MVDLDIVYGKVKYGKMLIQNISWKVDDFLPKNDNCFCLYEYMKIYENERSRSVSTFDPGIS